MGDGGRGGEDAALTQGAAGRGRLGKVPGRSRARPWEAAFGAREPGEQRGPHPAADRERGPPRCRKETGVSQ